jgi:hypothetical protein
MRALPLGVAALGLLLLGLAVSEPALPGPGLALAAPGEPTTSSDLRVASEPSAAELTTVVQQYCVMCHNDQLLTGNLSLQSFDVANAVAQAETSEKIINKLRLEMMPPPNLPRPGGDTLQLLAGALEDALDRASAAAPRPGVRRFQRMTVGEYERSIQGLLGLEVDASKWLPADVFLGSYDTWSDLQGLSALVVEAYLTAASEVSRMAIGNPSAPNETATYPVPVELSQHAWDHVEGTPYGTRGGMVLNHSFPVDGKYVIGVITTGGSALPSEDVDVSIDGEPVALLALPHGSGGGVSIETEPFFVAAGQRQLSVSFVRKNDGAYQDVFRPHEFSNHRGGGGNAFTDLRHLTDVTVTGPFEAAGLSQSPSRQKVFTCYPAAASEERACAESILERLATEAYRRPLEDEDLAGLLSFYDDARAAGDFDTGIRTALQAVLSNPSFLFRLEQQPENLGEGERYELSDVDLASRLSFFLWGTVPDAELMGAAEQGRLSRTDVLEAQVRRMLADPRSEALATRFAAQWLRLAALDGKEPVPYFYPDFSLDVSRAMRRETELFFDHLVREDKSFLEFFTADYTFVNDRLALHYGIPFNGGSEFQRVTHIDPLRVGILGHGSVLSLTSVSDRTSPVKRGEWVMEVLLGSPPPPPPPNVPELEATAGAADGRFLTTRERMERHRRAATCNSCHQFIDPIGLALDHFDPIGKTRVRENRMPIDPTGKYYDGTLISTPNELSAVLLKRPQPLVRTFTANLLGFAIGRHIEFYDRPAVRAIARRAEENDYRMSSFILGVVQSPQFRMRQVNAATDNANQQQ